MGANWTEASRHWPAVGTTPYFLVGEFFGKIPFFVLFLNETTALVLMDISGLVQKLQTFIPPIDLGMDLKTFTLLVAVLFFLISLLINLLQRRYSKARFCRMLTQEECVVDFLEGINKNLEDLEFKCSIELHGATSPQEVAKVISAARNRIESTLADMLKYLHSFRQYRRKEKAQKKFKTSTRNQSKDRLGDRPYTI